MKKLISLLLLFIAGQNVAAHDLNKFIRELVQEENVMHQVVDGELLKSQLESIKEGEKSDRVHFIFRLTEVETAALYDFTSETWEKYVKKLDSFKDGNVSESLFRVEVDGDNEYIFFEKEGKTITAICFLGIGEEAIIVMKMTGNFTESDIETGNLLLNILTVLYTLDLSQSVATQDLNELIQELIAEENVQHQVMDEEMIKTQLELADENDKTGEADFMNRLTGIEMVILEGCNPETIEKYVDKLNSIQDGNGYETHIRVEEDRDHKRIISEKDEDMITAVYILAIDEEDIAFVKMTGNFTALDVENILERQKKNL